MSSLRPKAAFCIDVYSAAAHSAEHVRDLDIQSQLHCQLSFANTWSADELCDLPKWNASTHQLVQISAECDYAICAPNAG